MIVPLIRLLVIFLTWMIGAVPTNAFASSPSDALRIVALGDSTTYGYSVEDNYPRQLARRLRARGIQASVINSGVNGDTTDGAQQRFEQDVIQHRPDIVIIQFGLNDQTIRLYQRPEEITSYVSQERFAANLRQFIVDLRVRDTKVILMTPNPMCWTPTLERHYPQGPYLDPPRGGNLLLQQYVAAVRRVAQEEKVPLADIFQAYVDLENTSGHSLHELFLDDGVHPNERGYEMNVDRLMQKILQIVEQDSAFQQPGLRAVRSAERCTQSKEKATFMRRFQSCRRLLFHR